MSNINTILALHTNLVVRTFERQHMFIMHLPTLKEYESGYIPIFRLHVFLSVKVSTQTFWPPRIQCKELLIYMSLRHALYLKSS